MHIDFWGLTLQAINFAVLAWLLHRFLYRPVLAMIDQRQALVEKDFHEARAAKRAAEVHLKGYEQRLTEIAAERERLLAEARTHIEVERREVLVHAEAEAAATIENQRRALEEERRAAADALGERAVELGLELARQLLGQLSAATVAEALLEGICRRLAELPPSGSATAGRCWWWGRRRPWTRRHRRAGANGWGCCWMRAPNSSSSTTKP